MNENDILEEEEVGESKDLSKFSHSYQFKKLTEKRGSLINDVLADVILRVQDVEEKQKESLGEEKVREIITEILKSKAEQEESIEDTGEDVSKETPDEEITPEDESEEETSKEELSADEIKEVKKLINTPVKKSVRSEENLSELEELSTDEKHKLVAEYLKNRVKA